MGEIWFQDEKDPRIIESRQIVITSPELWKTTLGKLHDINTYIPCILNRKPCWNETRKHTEHVYGGARQFQTKGFKEAIEYRNPRQWVYRKLDVNGRDDEEELLILFSTLELGSAGEIGASHDKLMEEFEQATKMTETLEKSDLDGATIKIILERMWPNFGFYATEGLNCTDLKTLKRYNLEELTTATRLYQKNQMDISKRVADVLTCETVAHENTKVLSLARKVNALSKR